VFIFHIYLLFKKTPFNPVTLLFVLVLLNQTNI